MDRRERLRTASMAVLAVVAVTAAVTLAACAGLPAPPGGDNVLVQDLKFIPSTITVQKGATVTWKNNDQTAHTITSDDFPDPATTETPPPGSFSSKPLSPGDTFTHKFEATGKFPYHCQIHPYLKGTVVVK